MLQGDVACKRLPVRCATVDGLAALAEPLYAEVLRPRMHDGDVIEIKEGATP